MNLGIVYASTQRYGEAENAYLTAIKHRHKHSDSYYNLGNLVSTYLNVLNYRKLNPKTLLSFLSLIKQRRTTTVLFIMNEKLANYVWSLSPVSLSKWQE